MRYLNRKVEKVLVELFESRNLRGHDGAPNEIEADKGEEVFKDFNKYVDNHFGKDSLINLMNTTENTHVYFGTDEYKIRMINIYWNSYQDSKNEK